MQRLPVLLALMTVIAMSSCSRSVTADDIIKKNMEARGGYEKIRTLRSVIFQGTTEAGGTSLDTKAWYVHNKGLRLEYSYKGKTSYTIWSKEGGWNYNPYDGKGAVPMQDKFLQDGLIQLDIQGLYVDHKEKGYTAEYMGKDTADGKNCDKIKLTKAGEGDKIYLFDDKHLLRKTIVYRLADDGSFQPGAHYYNDYREDANGYLFSYKRKDEKGRITSFNSIITNTEIPSSIFKPTE